MAVGDHGKGFMNLIDKTYIIAEIGVNHNGCLDEAIDLVYKSMSCGVNAVKFQKRHLPSLYSEQTLLDSNNSEWNFEYLIPQLEKLELSLDDYHAINKLCKSLDLDSIITPMDEHSVEDISNLNLSAVKIASADLVNIPLIKKCRNLNLPFLISTGLWEDSTIRKCASIFRKLKI